MTTGIVSPRVRGTELDDLRSGVVNRRVARRNEVGVARFVRLLAVRKTEAPSGP